MKSNAILLMLIALFASLLSAETTLNPTPEFSNGADIVVPADGQWQADLSSAAAVWEDFYQIIGIVAQNPLDHVPDGEEGLWADVQWTNDPLPTYDPHVTQTWLQLTPPAVQLGMLGSWLKGSVVYHFVAPYGKIFSGGTVDGVFGFAGCPNCSTQGSQCWFGVGKTLVTDVHTVTNVDDFNLIKVSDQYPSTGWVEPFYYEMNLSLPIPPGAEEFYVVISENYHPDSGSGLFGYNSLSVSATYTDLLQGDINKDFYVNIDDLVIMVSEWLECTDPENVAELRHHILLSPCYFVS